MSSGTSKSHLDHRRSEYVWNNEITSSTASPKKYLVSIDHLKTKVKLNEWKDWERSNGTVPSTRKVETNGV